jgi:outer membrane autotransporter protein
VWVRPNVWYDFLGNPVTSFSSADGPVAFHSTLGGAWGEINAGASGQLTSNVTLYANASYNQRFDDKGYSYDGKAGVRVNW